MNKLLKSPEKVIYYKVDQTVDNGVGMAAVKEEKRKQRCKRISKGTTGAKRSPTKTAAASSSKGLTSFEQLVENRAEQESQARASEMASHVSLDFNRGTFNPMAAYTQTNEDETR